MSLAMTRELTVHSLGRVEYADGLAMQKRFVQSHTQGRTGDTLLLLEHPPVITLGRGAGPENVVASPEQLASEGVEVFETDRGGDVTYHGPGQIVGYPLLHLGPDRQDVRRYVRDVEEVLIRTLAGFGISAARISKWPGVWVGEGTRARKIAAIGVHLSRWYTTHGFALNANTRLSHFELIVPCGIRDAGVTSMQQMLGEPVDEGAVRASLAKNFGEVFGAHLLPGMPLQKTVAVALLQSSPRRKVLLLHRTPDRGGFWQLTTGRVEPGETSPAAAGRELVEETGCTSEVHSLDYRHSFVLGDEIPPQLLEEECYFALADRYAEVILDAREHDTFEWVEPQEAIDRLPFMGLKRTVRAAWAALESTSG